MELTGHGRGRIYSRTKMHPDDVLDVISGNATVDLGGVDGGRYLLFYSPPDGDTKIAIVSEDVGRVVTILEGSYGVPEGVKRVTRKMKKEAHKLLQDFLFARLKAKNRQSSGAA